MQLEDASNDASSGHGRSSLPASYPNDDHVHPPIRTSGVDYRQTKETGFITVSPRIVPLLKSVCRELDDVLTEREVVDTDRQNYLRHQAHFGEVQKDFMDVASHFMDILDARHSSSQDFISLRKAWDRVQSSHAIFASKRTKFVNAERDLSKIEEKMLKQQEELYRSLPKLEDVHFDHEKFDDSLTNITSDLSHHCPQQGGPSGVISALAKHYYDKVGQVNGLRDDYLNFRGEHRLQLASRERSRESGKTVQPSEFPFLQSFYQELGTISQDFEKNFQEMWRLYRECQEKGVTVTEPDIPPLPNGDVFEDTSRPTSRIVQQAISSPQHEAAPGVTSLSALVEDPKVKEKVAHWLDEQSVLDQNHELDQQPERDSQPDISQDQGNRIDSMEVLALGESPPAEANPLSPA
jgi:hypothetical protein